MILLIDFLSSIPIFMEFSRDHQSTLYAGDTFIAPPVDPWDWSDQPILADDCVPDVEGLSSTPLQAYPSLWVWMRGPLLSKIFTIVIPVANWLLTAGRLPVVGHQDMNERGLYLGKHFMESQNWQNFPGI